VIVAHHLGEGFIPALVVGGAAAGPAVLMVVRAKLGRLGSWLHRRPR
jgi:hypothetical protein